MKTLKRKWTDAPAMDLLEACKLVREAFKTCTPYEMEQNGYDGAEEALDAIDNAIAKAEGNL